MIAVLLVALGAVTSENSSESTVVSLGFSGLEWEATERLFDAKEDESEKKPLLKITTLELMQELETILHREGFERLSLAHLLEDFASRVVMEEFLVFHLRRESATADPEYLLKRVQNQHGYYVVRPPFKCCSLL